MTTLRCSVSSDFARAYMLDWIVESRAGKSSFKPAFRIVSFSPESLRYYSYIEAGLVITHLLTATYWLFFISLGPISTLMGTPLSSQWLNFQPGL